MSDENYGNRYESRTIAERWCADVKKGRASDSFCAVYMAASALRARADSCSRSAGLITELLPAEETSRFADAALLGPTRKFNKRLV